MLKKDGTPDTVAGELMTNIGNYRRPPVDLLPSLAACLAAAIPAASAAVYITLTEKLSWSRLLLRSVGHDVTPEDALCLERSRCHDKRKEKQKIKQIQLSPYEWRRHCRLQ